MDKEFGDRCSNLFRQRSIEKMILEDLPAGENVGIPRAIRISPQNLGSTNLTYRCPCITCIFLLPNFTVRHRSPFITNEVMQNNPGSAHVCPCLPTITYPPLYVCRTHLSPGKISVFITAPQRLDVSGHFAVALNGLTSALKFATDLFLRVLHPSGNHREPRNYVIKRGLEDNSPFSLV